MPSPSKPEQSLNTKRQIITRREFKGVSGFSKGSISSDLKLPGLVLKARLKKCPTNASRNNSLEVSESKGRKEKEEGTYEELRDERKRAEDLRHMMVLGRIMEENHRKERKKREVRKNRKLFP